MRLTGETAIITGGSSGIGRAISLLFAKEGGKVAILDVDDKKGRKVADEIRASKKDCCFVKANVTNESQMGSAVDEVRKTLGRPTVLVTAAGANISDMKIVDYDMKQWDWLLNLNLRGVAVSCKYALKDMVKAKKGSIINISSSAGIEAIPLLGAYCASKAAVLMLTKVMALEYARDNIRVNCICPGNTITPLLKRAILRRLNSEQKKLGLAQVMRDQQKVSPIGRWAKPKEIANVALFLASKESSFVTGHALVADGGYLAGRPGGDTGLLKP